MGRKRNQYVREYYIEKDKECECKFCGHKISNYSTNLRRHLDQNHGEITKGLAKKAKIHERNTKETKSKFNVEMSKEELMSVCVDMIVKDCVPLTFFDSSSFRFLTNPFFNGLRIAQVNSANILDLVANKPAGIKNKIIVKLENEILNLKIVITTCNEREFLSINVPIITKNKIVFACLALLELENSQTAEYLQTKIENVLKDYQINKKQIYSITYDTGCSHFIKTLLDAEPAQQIQIANCFENLLNNLKVDNLRLFKCPAHTLQLSVMSFLENNVLKAPTLKKMGCSVEKSFSNILPSWTSTYTRLKKLLELKDTSLNNHAVSETEWLQIENIVAALETFQELFQNLQNSQLLLGDFYKYWMSLIFKLKTCDTDESRKLLMEIENRQTVLLENDTMYAALYLDPRFRRTLTNPKKQFAITHLKKTYLHIQSLEKENDDESLESPLTTAEENIMDESAMHSIIKTEETCINNSSSLLTENIEPLQEIASLQGPAIKTECPEYTASSSSAILIQNNETLQVPTMKTDTDNHTMPTSASLSRQVIEPLPENDLTKQKSCSLLHKYLQEMENSNASSDESDEFHDGNMNDQTRKVFLEIENYKEKRVDVDLDLLDYWNTKKFVLPWLRQLAMIVHSVPVTQITNERSFSALQMVLGDLHSNLSAKQFDSIMFLKLNTDV